jgi:glycosyltransferase involved in cell wall biosynthesis
MALGAPPPVKATDSLSVVILTQDEARNLPACLESIQGLARETLIVDSGSTDATLEIAGAAGCRIVSHPFTTHARQWSWALREGGLASGWVLALDADQSLTPEAREEVATLLEEGIPAEISGFYVKRRQIFRGRWIRHGGYYPKYLLKLFRLDRVAVPTEDLVDHHFRVNGRTERLRNDIVERNVKEDDIAFWIAKHVRYAELHAMEEIERRRANGSSPVVSQLCGTPDERVEAMKRVWARLPLYLRPSLYFVYRYVFRLGILDGREGFVFHFMQGFWYRVLVDVKLDEKRRAER